MTEGFLASLVTLDLLCVCQPPLDLIGDPCKLNTRTLQDEVDTGVEFFSIGAKTRDLEIIPNKKIWENLIIIITECTVSTQKPVK